MSWFRITNASGLPVHVSVSTAGVIQWCQNDVPAREMPRETGYTEVYMDDAIWHDLTVIPSNGKNQINKADNNLWKGLEIGVGVLGLAAAVIAAPFTGGASVAIAIAVAGGVIAVGDTVVSVVNFAIHPATVGNLYAPDGYNFEIGGGRVVGHYEKPQRFIITGYEPLTLKWHNNATHNEGTVVAGG